MLIFRSEEHLQQWVEGGHARGEAMTLEQQWQLARRWYVGRDRSEWTRRTAREAEQILISVGLTSDFWHLG